MRVPDHVKDKALASACLVGWFAGATFFILTFAISMNVALAITVALFFGTIFGWAAFNVLLNNYVNGRNQ